MMDEGIDPLSELVTVCNPFHGKYRVDTLFSSYAGVPIPLMVDDVNMEANMSSRAGGYTIVDLGMPEIATPQNFADLGLTIMNKAILHGPQRHYSVKSTWNLGKAGWVYCDADGVAWHLWADFGTTDAEINVYGDPISITSTRPSTLVATFTVPVAPSANSLSDLSSPYIATTFDPKGSGRAAIHVYVDADVYNNIGHDRLNYSWCVPVFALEVAVSGGAGTPLVVAQTLLTNDGFFTIYDETYASNTSQQIASVATVGWAPNPGTVPQDGPVYGVYSGIPYMRGYYDGMTTGMDTSPSPGNTDTVFDIRERLTTFVGIVYDAAGVRHKIDYARETTETKEVEFELLAAGQPVFECSFRPDLGDVWVVGQQVFNVGNFSPYITQKTTKSTIGEKFGFRRDGAFVDPMFFVKTTIEVSTRIENAETNPPLVTTIGYDMNSYVRINPEYGVPEFSCASYGDHRFVLSMIAPGQFQTYATPYVAPFFRRLGNYCTADYQGGFGWNDLWEVPTVSLDGIQIPRPFDGVIDRKVIVYF